MTLAIIGGVLWILGAIALLTGVLPADEALAVADRVWPILLFVVAVTVVAELASTAGLFDVVAARLARLARGRTAWLWVLVVALATVATAFLSLDTTAVLLTPVVVAMAVARKLDPLPFAFVTVVLANTASLVLPVSNLTNLLASDALGGHDPVAFLALLGPCPSRCSPRCSCENCLAPTRMPPLPPSPIPCCCVSRRSSRSRFCRCW
ncbi:Arsenical pump membrane protein [Microbacterium sp. Bi128]|nr:Arsenical pump membrane protein [Microbacterium sp. Bi128]